MKKLRFIELDTNEVIVEVNEETYGVIKFDNEQNVWVLWPADIDDGVSYFESLQETEDGIADEILEDDDSLLSVDMGDYDLIQVNENEFDKRYHSNVIGRNKKIYLADNEISTVLTTLEEIENEEDPDERWERVQFLEREYLR